MPDDLPDIDDPGFFTWPGCASLIGIFLAVIGIAMGVFYALQEFTEGLLLVIIFCRRGLLGRGEFTWVGLSRLLRRGWAAPDPGSEAK